MLTVQSEKHLYSVTATIEIELYVLAENDQEAIEVAKEHWCDEFRDADYEPCDYQPCEITNRQALNLSLNPDHSDKFYLPYSKDNNQKYIYQLLDELEIP